VIASQPYSRQRASLEFKSEARHSAHRLAPRGAIGPQGRRRLGSRCHSHGAEPRAWRSCRAAVAGRNPDPFIHGSPFDHEGRVSSTPSSDGQGPRASISKSMPTTGACFSRYDNTWAPPWPSEISALSIGHLDALFLPVYSVCSGRGKTRWGDFLRGEGPRTDPAPPT